MRRLVAITCLTLIAFALSTEAAEAGRRYLFTPSVRVEALYNDDVQYLGKGDIELHVRPQFMLEIDTARTEHTITATLDQYNYGDLTELDRTELGLSLETIYAATERLTLIGRVSHEIDYTLGTAEEEYGTTARKVRRGTTSLSGRAEYLLNERTVVGLNYGYSDTQFVSDYTDSSGHSLSGDIAWAATERLTLLGSVSTSRYESEFQDGGSGSFSDLGVSAGFRYRLTEIWTMFANTGRKKSWNDLDTSGIDEVISSSGNNFNVGLEWDYERSDGSVTYTRDTTTGLTGSILDRDRFVFEHNYRTTERSRLQFRVGMTETESDGVLATSENRSWSAGTTWWYDMTEDSRFWIGMTHYQSENLLTDTQNDRNTYFMRFDFEFPDEWSLGGARY